MAIPTPQRHIFNWDSHVILSFMKLELGRLVFYISNDHFLQINFLLIDQLIM